MSCPHVNEATLTLPSARSFIYKEECTQCFDSQDNAEGIDVCLTCFNGGCRDTSRLHAQKHSKLYNHPIVINIQRIVSDKAKRADDSSPPPQKISKLAIIPDEEEKYDFITKVRCYECGGIEIAKDSSSQLTKVVDAVMTCTSSAKQSEVQAWEEEVIPCEHTLCLSQDSPKNLDRNELAHCANCDYKDNLWLCLTCGNLGCGRRHYDGSGGNNHGLEHFQNTGHNVSCKLGTITPEGTADIYCYSCDDAKLDNELATHLANWGIMVSQQLKTEKSMTELQLEQNLKFDFSMTLEDGKQLEPKFGPGYTGLKNLGNSCYMAAVLQALFDINKFQIHYDDQLRDHNEICLNEPNPATCWYCQLHKIADGLLSGRYSQPKQPGDDGNVPYQDGISPSMFKALVGKDHSEFSTMRQQDAHEFFLFLCDSISKKEHKNLSDCPIDIFEFSLENRLQCNKCKKVRYQYEKQKHQREITLDIPAQPISCGDDESATKYEPVDLYDCLELLTEEVGVEFNCPHCQEKTTATKSTKFHTLPDMLVLRANRFRYTNWVQEKMDVTIRFPDVVELDKYLGSGQQEGEESMPEAEESQSSEQIIDQNTLNGLLDMGFPENRCKKAIVETNNSGVETAMSWLLEHMDDPDIDNPVGGSTHDISDENLGALCGMGFSEPQARKALKETDNNMERAVDWLFSHPDDTGDDGPELQSCKVKGDNTPPFRYILKSFVSHKGTSVHCGHYVAHILKDGQWVLYNDNKVAVAPNPPIGEAYLYFLQRVNDN